MQTLQKSAAEIASPSHFKAEASGMPAKPIVESLLAAKVAALQVEASAKVIVAGEESIGSILDAMA